MKPKVWSLLLCLALLTGVLTAVDAYLGGALVYLGGIFLVLKSRRTWPGGRGTLVALGMILAGALLATATFGLSCSTSVLVALKEGCRSQTLRQALNIHLVGALLGGVMCLVALWRPGGSRA